MDSNPFTQGNRFHPGAVYRFNIDNDGDSLADLAFSFTFSEFQNRRCMPRRCLTWETKSCGCRGSPTSPERR
jgi:hypothetical protein